MTMTWEEMDAMMAELVADIREAGEEFPPPPDLD